MLLRKLNTFSVFQRHADKDPNAMFYLALCYYHGFGIGQDRDKALDLFIKAWNKDVQKAGYYLGFYYLDVRYPGHDKEAALDFFETAALRGNYIPAYYEAGWRYLDGFDCEQDTAKGLLYLKTAANKGDINANIKLSDYYQSRGADISKGMKFVIFAAEHGDWHSRLALGAMYRDGQGVKADYCKAFYWLILAAVTHPIALVRGSVSGANWYFRCWKYVAEMYYSTGGQKGKDIPQQAYYKAMRKIIRKFGRKKQFAVKSRVYMEEMRFPKQLKSLAER